MDGKEFDRWRRMRLGVVPYTNCKPLITGLDCEIYEAVPSKLAQLAGPDDIILAPTAAAFEDPSLYILEGVGIGSFGPVETVKLFFNKQGVNIENLKSICLDKESKTSVALLKILLSKRYGTPSPLRGEGCLSAGSVAEGEGESDATLLIGDKVWKQGNKPALDLGEAWTEWTGLPFVFACWMTQNPDIGKKWKPKLIAQAKYNLENLNRLSTDPHLLRYWKQLRYELGPKQKEGIELFQKYWGEMEGKAVLPLKWI